MGVQANHVNISSLNMINNFESRVRHATGIDRKNPVKNLIPSLRTVMMMSGQHVEDHLLYY